MPPDSFDEGLLTEWSLWVLTHGLPELPESVRVGESVPVARWVGARFGAVAHVQWMWTDDHADDRLGNEIETFRRRAGRWEASNGNGGSGWHSPPFRRPSRLGPRDVEDGGRLYVGGDGWRCCAVDGIAGEEAAVVELVDAGGTTGSPIESPFGAFVVVTDADREATVRVLDQQARELWACTLSPNPFNAPDT
jgi:hypothetical protein